MSGALKDLLLAAFRRPDPAPFPWDVGQVVRVKRQITRDGQTPGYWAGAYATVIARRSTLLHKDHWYTLRHNANSRMCDFREEEIDRRSLARQPACDV